MFGKSLINPQEHWKERKNNRTECIGVLAVS
jgi:hypothetical protein